MINVWNYRNNRRCDDVIVREAPARLSAGCNPVHVVVIPPLRHCEGVLPVAIQSAIF